VYLCMYVCMSVCMCMCTCVFEAGVLTNEGTLVPNTTRQLTRVHVSDANNPLLREELVERLHRAVVRNPAGRYVQTVWTSISSVFVVQRPPDHVYTNKIQKAWARCSFASANFSLHVLCDMW
jgi:hypothetical protein